MEKLKQTFKDEKFNFWQDLKAQFIRSTKLYFEPIPLFWRYIQSPGKKSPLKDFWRYINTPYTDKELWGE